VANRAGVGATTVRTASNDHPAKAIAKTASEAISWNRIPYPGYRRRTTTVSSAARPPNVRAARNHAVIEAA
jgi:hypothetical protein